jgi:hypothetical protein
MVVGLEYGHAQSDNDLFRWRQPISGTNVQVYGYAFLSTVEPGEPSHSALDPVKGSIWWTWKSPDAGFLTLFVNQGGQQMVLAAYSGETLEQLTLVGRTYERAPLRLRVQRGVSYQIAYGVTAENKEPLQEVVGLSVEFAPFATNDAFSNSLLLPPDDSAFAATLIDVTREPLEPNHSSVRPGLGSLWWNWRPARSGLACINRGVEYFRTILAAYEGETLDTLRRLGSARAGELLTFPVEAGRLYRIALAQELPTSIGRTYLKLAVSELKFQQPSNGQSFPPHSGVPIRLSGIPPRAGEISVSHRGVELARIPAPSSGAILSNLASGPYELLATYSSEDGYVVLSPKVQFTVSTEGDSFSEPMRLEGDAGMVTGEDHAATLDPSEPPPWNGSTSTLWWTWTSPAAGRLLVNSESYLGLGFECFVGDALDALASVADVSVGPEPWQQAFEVRQGTVYRLRSFRAGPVGSGESRAFAVPFQLVPKPSHDHWAQRRKLTSYRLDEPIWAGGASLEGGEPNVLPGDYQTSVWYEWTPPRTGLATVVVRQPNGLPWVHVYAGPDRLALVEGTYRGLATQTWMALSNVSYQIQVIGTPGLRPAVEFSFHHTARPANDGFLEAIAVSGKSGELVVNTEEATRESGEPIPGFYQTVWYRWQAPATGMLELTGVTEAFPGPSLKVFSSPLAVPTLQSLVLHAHEYGSDGIYSVKQGTTYFLWVGNNIGATSQTYSLSYTLHQAPENDAFARRQALTGIDVSLTASQWAATREPGEPKHAGASVGRSVWWTWTAPTNGSATVAARAVPSEIRSQTPYLAVYTGSAVNSLTLVSTYAEQDSYGVASFAAQAGKTYQIALDNPGPAVIGGVPSSYPGTDVELELHFTTLKLVSPITNQNLVSPQPVVLEINQPVEAFDGKIVGVTYVVGRVGSQPTVLTEYVQTGTPPFRLVVEDHPTGAFVAVAVATNDAGRVSVSPSVAFTRRPANDGFATRIAVEGRYGLVQGTLEGATREAGEPLSVKYPSAVSLWYSWKAPSDGWLEAESVEAGEVAVYSGGSLAQLTRVSANVNTGYAGTAVRVTRDTTYAIAVRNIDDFRIDTARAFQMRWKLRSVELLQPTAGFSAIAGRGITLSASITERRSEFDAVRFLVDGQEVARSMAASSPFTQLWTPSAPGLYAVKAEVALSSGILVASDSVTVQVRPTNDTFIARSEILGTGLQVAGSTIGSQVIESQKSCWYRWRAPATGLLRLATTNQSLTIGVFQGGEVSALFPVEERYQRVSGAVPGDRRYRVEADVEYGIQVASSGFLPGLDFSLSMDFYPVPANDAFAQRAVLPSEPGRYDIAAVSAFATAEPNEPDHGLSVPRYSLWWRFVPPRRGAVRILAENLPYTLGRAVYRGAALESLTRIPSAAQRPLEESDWWQVEAGVEYQIAVDDLVEIAGPFSFVWEYVDSSPNDSFALRQRLEGKNLRVAANTFWAGREPGEPAHMDMPDGASLWWTWTAPENGTARFSYLDIGMSWGASVSVYAGNKLSELSRLAVGEHSVSFPALKGQTYEFALDVYRGFPMAVDLELELTRDVEVLPPENDLFDHRLVVSGASAPIHGANQLASREWHEPLHASQFGGRSVWYAWTAPRSGQLHCRLTGAFAKLLGIYQGQQVDRLEVLGSRLEFQPELRLEIPVRSGHDYVFAVDGWLGRGGDFDLSLQLDSTHAQPEVRIDPGDPGFLRLRVLGMEGHTGRIETSGDLAEWALFKLIPAEIPIREGVIEFVTSVAGTPAALFYRVRLDP